MKEKGKLADTKETIVGEGNNDRLKTKKAVQAETIETNGSAVSESPLDMVRHAHKERGVIIFTDPEYPGERIRHITSASAPGCKHAFLPKKEADSGKSTNSIGVEHASVEAIQTALEQVYEVDSLSAPLNDITRSDLMQYGLLGGAGAKSRREALGDTLHIGYTNGKQLLHR